MTPGTQPGARRRPRRPTPGAAVVAGVVGVVAALVVGGAWLAGPGAADSPAPDDAEGSGREGTDALTGEVVVLAAASLAEPLEVLAADLEALHPGLDVTVSVGPSSALAAQVAAGAPADVLATASPETMATAVAALDGSGGDVEPVVVATNGMALAVPGPAAPGGAGDVDALADLDGLSGAEDPASPRGAVATGRDVRYAVCQEQVPCGAGAAAVLAEAGVVAAPATFEHDVGGVLTKVASGEVDAGLVYASDVHPGATLVREGRVVGVPLDSAWTTSYPVLALPDAPHPAAARAVVALLASERGAAALRDAGFGPPP